MQDKITLAMGNGGQENNELISKIFYKAFQNDVLNKSEDSAILKLDSSKVAMSTDSFTVSPIFFNGGDIGKLSICGTCNDLAMMGAKPKFLTCSVMIEEGFDIEKLERIVESMRKELEVNEALIVSGDTKVVPRGAVDKIFINTTGIGEIFYDGISAHKLEEGMSILVSRDVGAHGATIFIAREGMEIESDLKTDCESLYPQIKALVDAKVDIVATRDATRGGVAAVLNEWAKASKVCIEIEEQSVPVCDEVNGVCELLGFEALNLANEGTFVLCVPSKDEQKALEVLKTFYNSASIVGKVSKLHLEKVVLNSPWGTKRFLDMPSGELLPRIC